MNNPNYHTSILNLADPYAWLQSRVFYNAIKGNPYFTNPDLTYEEFLIIIKNYEDKLVQSVGGSTQQTAAKNTARVELNQAYKTEALYRQRNFILLR